MAGNKTLQNKYLVLAQRAKIDDLTTASRRSAQAAHEASLKVAQTRKPRVKRGIIFATPYNPPLPRLDPQPVRLTMMMVNRRKALQRQADRLAELKEERAMIQAERDFERNVGAKSGPWELQALNDELGAKRASLSRGQERAKVRRNRSTVTVLIAQLTLTLSAHSCDLRLRWWRACRTRRSHPRTDGEHFHSGERGTSSSSATLASQSGALQIEQANGSRRACPSTTLERRCAQTSVFRLPSSYSKRRCTSSDSLHSARRHFTTREAIESNLRRCRPLPRRRRTTRCDDSAMPAPIVEVPTISFADFESEQGFEAIASRIREAGHRTGFFVLKDHGIAPELCDETLAVCKRLFDLPVEEVRRLSLPRGHCLSSPVLHAATQKLKLNRDPWTSRGYDQLANQSFGEDGRPDQKEGFQFGSDGFEPNEYWRDDGTKSRYGHGPNKYPPAEVLPGLEGTMKDYVRV